MRGIGVNQQNLIVNIYETICNSLKFRVGLKIFDLESGMIFGVSEAWMSGADRFGGQGLWRRLLNGRDVSLISGIPDFREGPEWCGERA